MEISDENIQKLADLLNNPQKPLHERFRALFTLRNLGGELAIQGIGHCFVDSSALLRHELAYVLGQMQNPVAVPILNKVLRDVSENSMVRHEAAEALGAIGLEESMTVLQEFVNDPIREVSETCQIALDRIKYEKLKKEKQLNDQVPSNPFYSVDPAPPCKNDSTEQLLEKMMDKNQTLFERYRAMFSLRNKASKETNYQAETDAAEISQSDSKSYSQEADPGVPPVLALTHGLDDDSALFRHEIAYVLGQLAHPAAVPALVRKLKDESEHEMVRHECAEALGSIATKDVLPILQSYRQDKHRVVKESCDVAMDMYEYENSGQFQYADGLSKITQN